MKYIYGSLLLLALAATDVRAVHLGESPIREAMQASIASDSWVPGPALLPAGDDDEFGGSFSQSTPGEKSIFKAALYSALIPGGGQYYLGKRKTARFFFAAEVLTWLGYFSFRTYGNWRRNDFIDYAAIHANAQLEGKSEEFLAWVGFYESIRDFNNLGRAWDPQRPYLPDTPENHWQWNSQDERQTYRDIRNRSKEAYRRSDFMIGVAVLDRIVSIVDAVRSTGRINRRIGGSFSSPVTNQDFKFSVNPFSSRRQICFTVYPGF